MYQGEAGAWRGIEIYLISAQPLRCSSQMTTIPQLFAEHLVNKSLRKAFSRSLFPVAAASEDPRISESTNSSPEFVNEKKSSNMTLTAELIIPQTENVNKKSEYISEKEGQKIQSVNEKEDFILFGAGPAKLPKTVRILWPLLPSLRLLLPVSRESISFWSLMRFDWLTCRSSVKFNPNWSTSAEPIKASWRSVIDLPNSWPSTMPLSKKPKIWCKFSFF